MKRELYPIGLILCLLTATVCHAERHSIKALAKPAEPAEETAPAPPPTLEQMPAAPPEVTFAGGQLTITASNSTLADILQAVKTKTGAGMDVPGNPTDRVVGKFGPGPARDVLGDLLNGSHFNYVLLGSASDPNALDRIILMAKSGGVAQQAGAPEQPGEIAGGRPAVMAAPMSAPGFAAQPAQASADADDSDSQDADADDSSDDSSDSDSDSADDSADQTQDQQQGVAAEAQDNGDNGQNGVKTPQQLLQEMQQQNLGQPGTPGAPGTPPGMPPGMNPRLPPGTQMAPH